MTYYIITSRGDDSSAMLEKPTVVETSFWIDDKTYMSSSPDYIPVLWNVYQIDNGSGNSEAMKHDNVEEQKKVASLVNRPNLREVGSEYMPESKETRLSKFEKIALIRLNEFLETLHLPIRLVK